MNGMDDTTKNPLVAYFSMEIGLDPSMPTYAGGLGVLAGDTIRSAADLEVPMVAVTNSLPILLDASWESAAAVGSRPVGTVRP